MSQFDSLLDFEDTGTTNPPKQQTTDTADPFDPIGAPDSNVNANGGGGGDLLDLGFDMQVSSQNGSAKLNIEANTNPLYELSNNQSEDTSNNAPKDTNIFNSEPVNLLYELSNDTQTQDIKSTSSNPLYDFLENENTEERTNGHTEDLLGTTESNDIDLLSNSGPIVSDDSGVTMDTNHLDGTQEVEEGQRNGETSEESDIQGKPNIDEPIPSKTEETINGSAKEVEHEDQINKGPMPYSVDQSQDQDMKEQNVKESVEADESPAKEPEHAETNEGPSIVDQEPETAEETADEVVKDESGTDESKSTGEVEIAQEQEVVNQDVKVDKKIEGQTEYSNEKQVAADDDIQSETTENSATQQAEEETVSEEATKVVGPSVEVADNEVVTESALTEDKEEQLTHLNKDNKEEQQAEEGAPDKSEAEPVRQEPEPINQEPAPVEQEIVEQIKPEPEPIQPETEPVRQDGDQADTKGVEGDEDTSQSKQTDKQTDSSKDKVTDGAVKVNGTSVENDVGDEEPVRDPNVFRETREKEEVHFTELSNVRQRFESGASAEDDTPKRHHSVKDDYDQGGEFESTPTVNPDTVKETDAIGEELPEIGMAKNLLSKFQQLEKESAVPKPSSERRGVTPPRQSKVEYESTPKDKLEEYVGKSDTGVFESQPKVNEGVIRYGEQVEEEPQIESGYAKNIVSRYKEIEQERAKVQTREKKELTPDRTGKVEYVSEPRGESIKDYDVKVESGVFESTPKVEEDVVRADEKPDEILPEEGYAKNLLSKFKQLETEVANRPPPSPVRSGTPKRDSMTGTRGYLEKYVGKSDEPIEVVRCDEQQEDIKPEAGTAKKGMERFKELEKQSSSPPAPGMYRKEITPPRENAPGQTMAGVLENQPAERLEGVVKSTDVYDTELPEKGTAKNVASFFKQRIDAEGSPTVPSPTRGKKEFTPPPEAGVYESKPAPSLVVEQRQAESGVLESTPTGRLDVAREHDPSPEKELPETGYAKNMVNKFKQLESESAKGSSSGSPQKYKEFTPPRDAHGLLSPKSPAGLSEGVNPSDLPGQYQQQVSAGVFENQPEARPDLMRESDTDWNEGLPASGAAKSMKARFQEMESKALKELETPEPIHRKDASLDHSESEDKGMFITVQPDKCSACEKTVYAMEKLEMNKNIYHRGCFKCSHCSATLTAKTFSINEGVIYCTTHFKQLFARKGNYDEGFGRQQYKKKWVEEQLKNKDTTA